MSEYSAQDNGTLRVTIREAAHRLGVTQAAIRKRIRQGSLDTVMGEDGRVYVCLDLSQNISHPELEVHYDLPVEELIAELRDRVAYLEYALERRSVEAERYQQIIGDLTQTNNRLASRLRELEAPSVSPRAAESVAEGSGKGQDQEDAHGGSENRPPDTAEWPARGGLLRPWWRRAFG